MRYRRLILLVLLSTPLVLPLSALAEDLTFTTYYPAPPAGGSASPTQKPQRLAVGIDPAYGTAIDAVAPGTATLLQGPVAIGTASVPVNQALNVQLTSNTGNPTAAQVAVGGTGSGSAGYTAFQASAGATGTSVSNTGILGIGSGGGSANYGGSFIGMSSVGTTASIARGLNATGRIDGSATSGFGLVEGAVISAQQASSMPVTELRGIQVLAANYGSGLVSAGIGVKVNREQTGGQQSVSYGVQINDPSRTGGTIGTNYGLYLDNQTAGTTNYAIYSVGGQSYFAGSVGLGTITPGAFLDVVSNHPTQVSAIRGQQTRAPTTTVAAAGVSGKSFDSTVSGALGLASRSGSATYQMGVYGTGPVPNTGTAYAGYFVGDVVVGPTGNGQLMVGTYAASGSNAKVIAQQTGANAAIYGATGDSGVGVLGVVGSASYSGSAGVLGASGTASSNGVQGECTATGGTGVRGRGRSYDFYAARDLGEVAYGQPSSIRWKHDIQPLEHALDKVLTLRGVSFTWDAAHGSGRDFGLIGEEVGRVFPEIVAYEPNGHDATGMDYGKLTAVLVEAVKAQQRQLDQLKTENHALQRRLDRLDRR